MINVKVISTDKAKIVKYQSTIHSALAGSPAYMGVEICITPLDDKSDGSPIEFTLIIGNNNGRDITTTLDLDNMSLTEFKRFKTTHDS